MDKILLVKTGATGDVLRTSVLLHILQGEIYWITKQANIALFPDNVAHIRFIPEEKVPEEIFTIPFDLIINLEEDANLAARLRSIRARQVIGLYLKNDQLLYTDDSAEWFNMSLVSKYPTASNELKQKNTRSYQEIVYGMLGKKFSGQEYICYHPGKAAFTPKITVGIEKRVGRTWPNKNWHGYDELASVLTQQGLEVRVFEQRKHLREYLGDIANCDFLISGDTLAMHVALAYKIKSISIFNCTSPKEIFDYGVTTKIVSRLLEDFFYQRERVEEVIQSVPVTEVYAQFCEVMQTLPVK